MTINNQPVEIIKSKLFSKYPEIICGLSTKNYQEDGNPYSFNMSYNVGDKKQNVDINRKIFLSALNVPQNLLAIPRQIHSDKVLKIDKPGTYKTCDALITNKSKIFLSIIVADCVPIFLYDQGTKSIAIVHAGWRGSSSNILKKTVQMMCQCFSTHPNDLIAFIGPSIGVCCYEVGNNVVNKFDNKYILHRKDGGAYLDLKLFNQDSLLESGVKFQNIEVSAECTLCNPKLFHSYRRDGQYSGRMMGIIGMY